MNICLILIRSNFVWKEWMHVYITLILPSMKESQPGSWGKAFPYALRRQPYEMCSPSSLWSVLLT